MSNKKNLPNIPIYIGDWERDCNVLSLEAEAAWMRVIFKMWTKGKQNTIKIPAKSLQNLWRCSKEQVQDILNELMFNEIAEIQVSEGFIEFGCRRFMKENELSEVRSKAAKSSYNSQNKKANAKQTSSKSVQNTENDYENENENEIKDKIEKGGVGEKNLHDTNFDLDIQELKSEIDSEFSWKEMIIRNAKEIDSSFSAKKLEDYLETFFKLLEGDGEETKNLKDFKKHFNRWLKIQIEKSLKNQGNDRSSKTNQQLYNEAINSEAAKNFKFS